MGSTARPRRPFGLLLAGVLCLPALPTNAAALTAPIQAPIEAPAPTLAGEGELIAKKGGGGHKGKSGGSRKKSSRSKSGFKSSGSSMSKGKKQPKGGWSKKSNHKNNPSLDNKNKSNNKKKNNNKGNQAKNNKKHDNKNKNNKQAKKNDRRDDKLDKREKKADRRDDRLDKRDKKLDKRADRVDKKWDKRYDRWDDRWDRYPGWARPGWGYARPWNYGWYDSGYRSSNWGWNAAAFGLTTLTTAAIINSAVDNAVSNQTTYVVVPNTDYRLLYGTVEPINDQSVRFAVEAGSGETYFDADCNRGTLNGRNPTSASEAELLNAACQVAYGSV